MENFSLHKLFSIPQTKNERILDPWDSEKVITFLINIDAYANEKLGIHKLAEGQHMTIEMRSDVRSAWYKNPEIIDGFIAEYKSHLPEEEIQAILGWKQQVQGKFILVKYFPDCAVFASLETNSFYAVKGLTEDFDQVVAERKPPFICQTTLLGYKDVIIWDGLFGIADATFSRVQTMGLLDLAKQLRRNNGLIKTLVHNSKTE